MWAKRKHGKKTTLDEFNQKKKKEKQQTIAKAQ